MVERYAHDGPALDLPESELLPLFREAIKERVFSEEFLAGLRVNCSTRSGHPDVCARSTRIEEPVDRCSMAR
jgi:hypothetical protein